MFDLKLEKHLMILKDKRNIYGEVLQGSYIIVEGACITCEALDQLLVRMSLNPNRHLTSVADDYKWESAIDMLIERDDKYKGPKRRVVYDDHKKPDFASTHPFCMYFMTSNNRIEALLLSWVDQEERVARRVGRVHLEEFRGEYFDHFKEGLHAADWQRWKLKLI